MIRQVVHISLLALGLIHFISCSKSGLLGGSKSSRANRSGAEAASSQRNDALAQELERKNVLSRDEADAATGEKSAANAEITDIASGMAIEELIEAGSGKAIEENQDTNGNMSHGNLIWKRYRALETGIMSALQLTKDEVCLELGTYNCVEQVALSHLGGNDITTGHTSSVKTPTALTPVAIDRIILHACLQRVQKDSALGMGQAEVFKQLPLGPGNLTPESARALGTEMYKRFLARLPTEMELEKIVEYAMTTSDGESAAVGVCYAVGTLAENIFH